MARVPLPQEPGLKAPRSPGCRCRGECISQFPLARRTLCAGGWLHLAEPPGPFGASLHLGGFAAGDWSQHPDHAPVLGMPRLCCLIGRDPDPAQQSLGWLQF